MRSTETRSSRDETDPQPTSLFDVPWHREGNCYSKGYDNFFQDAKLGAMEAIKKAKRVCIDCPVARQCLGSALKHRDSYGIWGGYTPRDRRRMLEVIDNGEFTVEEVLDRACD